MGSLAMVIVCLGPAGAAGAGEESKKTKQAVTDEKAAPEREIPVAEERARRLTDRMKERLGLTEEQIPRVAEVNLRIAKQVDDIRSASEGSRSELSSNVRSLQEQRNKELKEILNGEQWKEYEKMQEEMRSKGRDRGKEYRGKGGEKSGGEPTK